MDIIKTTKLTKYYGKARGIIDLDLTVTHGEFFGFIGPNGAGKSTTIRTLLGLIAPTSGSAMIFGYCEGADIIVNGSLDGIMVAIGAAIGIGGIIIAYLKYTKKDIH